MGLKPGGPTSGSMQGHKVTMLLGPRGARDDPYHRGCDWGLWGYPYNVKPEIKVHASEF